MNVEFHGGINQVNSKMVNGSHRRATKQGTFSSSASINARTYVSFPARRKLAADHRFHFSANDGSNQHHHRHETGNLVLFPVRLAIRTRLHVPSNPPIPTQSKPNQTITHVHLSPLLFQLHSPHSPSVLCKVGEQEAMVLSKTASQTDVSVHSTFASRYVRDALPR